MTLINFPFQRNHSLFGSVWSSMRRGHAGFHRARSLKVNSTQIKVRIRLTVLTIDKVCNTKNYGSLVFVK